jgi:hypothetical protein
VPAPYASENDGRFAVPNRLACACSWLAAALFCASIRPAAAAAGEELALAPDSPRWELEGEARPAEYLGRKCLSISGGGARVKDLDLADGVVDVDVATPARRGFFGIQFRIEGANGEWVYLRQHKSGLPDAMQYTPILNTGLNWQIYNGPGFTGALEIPRDVWFHVRLVIAGAQAKLYVRDMDKPALEMPDLKSGNRHGQIALAGGRRRSLRDRAREIAPLRRRGPLTPITPEQAELMISSSALGPAPRADRHSP